MELKKSQKANLENKKIIIFEISIILTLLLILTAFEWSSPSSKTNLLSGNDNEIVIEDEIINTFQKEDTPPPPPPKPQVIEIINIVDNDITIDDELEMDDMDTNIDEEIAVKSLDEEEEEDENEVFFIVENMPKFPGGEEAMRKFIAHNVNYPEIAVENGISGKVIVSFVVNKKGKATNIKILRGVDPIIDREAKLVITKLPNFKPGMQRGKPVNVSYVVPVSFRLQ